MARILLVEEKGLFRDLMINYLLIKGITIFKVCESVPEEATIKRLELGLDALIINPFCLSRNRSDLKKRLAQLSYTNISILLIDKMYEEEIFDFVGNGFGGIIIKNDNLEELITCIRQVSEGGTFLSTNSSRLLLERKYYKRTMSSKLKEQLTERELDIVKLMLEFKTNKEISKELFISYKTVKNHKGNISDKFECKGRGKLLKFLLQYKDDF